MADEPKHSTDAITWMGGEDGLVGAIRGRPDLRVEANQYHWRVVEIATKHLLVERMVDDHAIQRVNRKASRGRGMSRLTLAQARCASWVEQTLGIKTIGDDDVE